MLTALAVLLVAAPADAQYTLGGMRLEGEVEAGGRFFLEEPSKTRSAKFQEYRDVDDGLFLGRFYLRAFRPDESYSTEFEGSRWGQEDQTFSLRSGRLGLWEFGFDWDQMRHVLYTNTRFLATEPDRGVYVLPTPRPPLALHNAAPERDLSVRWDTAHILIKVTPTPNLDLRAEYTRIRKDGDRPMGMAFGSPGNNFYEVIEPIEHTIHDFRIQGVYAADVWQVQWGYNLSVFDNDERRIIADNPCFANAAQCGAGDGGAAAPARGQSSLPPSNMAHTFHLAAGVTLPMRSRIHGNFAYSLRLQNDSFLPHTINPALAGDPDLRLPQKSLNGNVQIINLNIVGTTRPWSPVTFTGKYRLYEQLELSDRPFLDAVVVNDRSITREVRHVARLDFTRHNADLDARVAFGQPLAVTVGTGWERWDRSSGREAKETDEFFGKLAIDATPTDWVQARVTYRPSYRRYAHYNPHARAETLTVEDVTAELAGQSVFLRKYDEADRDRQRVDALVTFTPLETVTITPTFGYRWDDYPQSHLGLQQEMSISTGLDVSVTPSQWLGFGAGYVYENVTQRQRQRNRISLAGGATSDFVDYEWVSNNSDEVHTAYASVRGAIIPHVVDWSLGANWSYALGRVNTNNPVNPQSGTAAQDATARAKPWPAFEDQLFRLEALLRYHFAKSWTATFGYAWESFEKHDWRTDTLNPFVPIVSTAGTVGQTSIWQGNDVKSYTAHIVGMSLTYRFK
jgi:MtrB/PioB family decaheme-associated outer membrane protein